MNSPDRLAGKVALITGAGSGIGAATARIMAEQGARIVVTGIPDQPVHDVAAELESAGHVALAVPTDVSDAAQVQAAYAKAVDRFGRVDIVVPNAAVQLHDVDRNLHEMDDDVWDRVHNINYRGVYLTCKHGLARFIQQGDGGVIVMVISITALGGSCANPAYVSGKHGLVGLNRYIAVHYAEHGIRCNAVLPGALERTPNHDIHPNPDGRARRLAENIPLGRPGTPEDIAPFIAFLAGPDAGYANGASVVVDGGLTVS